MTVALVGHTGAGKSTIAKLIARFYDPTEGRDRDRRRRPAHVRQEALRRQLGIVPQEGFLFAGTIKQNIAFGRRRRRKRRSSPPPAPSARDEFIARLENGYDTELGERGFRLSLGQRQLVAFARALLADPRILILDEATSSVDIGTEQKIERALRRAAARRTAFVIAHRLSTIRDADLIVVLEHGLVVEQGTHDDLLARGGLYASCTGTGPRRRLRPANDFSARRLGSGHDSRRRPRASARARQRPSGASSRRPPSSWSSSTCSPRSGGRSTRSPARCCGRSSAWPSSLIGTFLVQGALTLAVDDVRDGRVDSSIGELYAVPARTSAR